MFYPLGNGCWKNRFKKYQNFNKNLNYQHGDA